MGVNDLKLIQAARGVDPIDWSDINDLIAQAQSDEAKEVLELIKNIKYRKEEYESGLN